MGPGATAANQIASVTLTPPALDSVGVSLFTGPSLGPGTYYLVLSGPAIETSPATPRKGASFNAGPPRVWSPTLVRRIGVHQSFDVSADGKRVVMFPGQAAENVGGDLHATFLLNFFDEVRRRLPMGSNDSFHSVIRPARGSAPPERTGCPFSFAARLSCGIQLGDLLLNWKPPAK